MKHFILPFARTREQTQTKVWGDGVERERELSERCGQSTQNDLVNNSAQEQKYQK